MPRSLSVWMMSITRVLRMSETFSLKVTPRTQDSCMFDRSSSRLDQRGRALGYVVTHRVVDLSSGQYHVRNVTDLLGGVGEVVGIHTDAVAANQARFERGEIPLGARSPNDFVGVDAETITDHRQLVHERYIQIALRVLDDLGRLGGLDAG